MVKGSDIRKTQVQVDKIFLDRWSPRAMSGEPIEADALAVLFEAARWAPSSGNAQPWRILYARRDTPAWPTFLGLLVASNQAWAQHAAALLVFISRQISERTGRPAVTHAYDTGAAWENLALQGSSRGYVVHGMEGFDYERARIELAIPPEFQVQAMAAVGKPGNLERLPEHLQKRESPNDRRPLEQTVCEGKFSFG
ncbi:MAG TPA: nitroreductase family protein [Steroidobacteraceae bacterium]|nr:nitroreductase family protein [Steroidobacteraceae bacterium]